MRLNEALSQQQWHGQMQGGHWDWALLGLDLRRIPRGTESKNIPSALPASFPPAAAARPAHWPPGHSFTSRCLPVGSRVPPSGVGASGCPLKGSFPLAPAVKEVAPRLAAPRRSTLAPAMRCGWQPLGMLAGR